MARIIPGIAILLLLNILFAQTKELTLEDVVLKREDISPQLLKDIQWIQHSNRFSYVDKIDTSEVLFIDDARRNAPSRQVELAELNRWTTAAGLKKYDKFPPLHWIGKTEFRCWKGDTLLRVDIRKKRVRQLLVLKKEDKNRDVAEKSLRVAYTRKNNLYLLSPDGQEIAVTSDPDSSHVYGQQVHRNEFGIQKGTFWSPKENHLAFYRKDESMVSDYPYVDFSTRPARLKPGKYPMAGMANHIATVGVYHLQSGKICWLQTGDPADQYLTNISWTPDEKYILIAHINRDQNHLRMIKYDIESGLPVKTLFEEHEAKYVDPQVGAIFLPNDSGEFLWLSRRDGWNHFYLYDSDGNLQKQLTRGHWEVLRFDRFDKQGRFVYFTANKLHPLNREFYRVELKSGRLERLTEGSGTHTALVSCDGEYFIDTFSNLQTPGVTALYKTGTTRIRLLKEASNPLHDFRVGEVQIKSIPTAAGDTLFSRIIYPPDFNPTQQYPVIVYVYGGPHSQLVRNRWLGGAGSWPLWLNYLATRGYIIFTVDNRGTYYRGRAFEQATFRQLGTVEVADQLEALTQLKTLAYIDTNRIGVVGWSYGGFMTCSLMLRSNHTFKVAIAGAPVIDWRYYETIYTERYMDMPGDNPDGYEKSDVRNYVKNLQGKLLVIHGTSDPIVMWQHTILFLKAAITAGVQPDYFVYPGHKHGIRGKDRLHLLKKMTNYFEEYL